MEQRFENITINGLYVLAYRAHTGTSFSPEKRAKDTVQSYETELNEDLANMPESEKALYIERYTNHLTSWLRSKSNCISSMITGPANFPVRRAEKANRSEMNKYNEFRDWREKALNGIAKRIEEAKPQEQKDNEEFEIIKRDINRVFDWRLSVTNLKNRLETVAKHGNVDIIRKTLDYLDEKQNSSEIIIATQKHSIWNLVEVAESYREKQVDKANSESDEQEINGVRVVKNHAADRIQLFFDGKPAAEMITKLKKNAFKWSPSQMCWQRQLTQNAIYATQNLLK